MQVLKSVPSSLFPPILVNAKEAARMLSISPRKLWDLKDRGEIPHVKSGGTIRYRVTDLHAWVEKMTR